MKPSSPPALPGQARIARTGHECNDPVRLASQGERASEVSAAQARGALQQWEWALREVALEASSDVARTALRGLSAWYERMCVDDTYADPAPADGLDALTAQERAPHTLTRPRVLVTHWALRVAQELAGFRKQGQACGGDPAAAYLAHAKLDLALQGAIDSGCESPTSSGASASSRLSARSLTEMTGG
jgi:hypothetical protein